MLTLLIPVNRLERAKGRLAAFLSEGERKQLALTTFLTVFEGCLGLTGCRTVVVTADPQVQEIATRRASACPEDPSISGLNPQLERAVTMFQGHPVMIIHADLPLFTSAAVQHLQHEAGRSSFALINPSGDGGTNVMYLSEPMLFPLAYGPGSAAKHFAAAEAAGMHPRYVHYPDLELDLDTPADLATLLSTPSGRESPAGRLLTDWGVEQRLRNPHS